MIFIADMRKGIERKKRRERKRGEKEIQENREGDEVVKWRERKCGHGSFEEA